MSCSKEDDICAALRSSTDWIMMWIPTLKEAIHFIKPAI
jgi:hypothetical protein